MSIRGEKILTTKESKGTERWEWRVIEMGDEIGTIGGAAIFCEETTE